MALASTPLYRSIPALSLTPFSPFFGHNVANTLDIDGLIQLFDDHCRQDEWREVLRLICGQIDEMSVGRIVERLATRMDLEKWDGHTPLPELPLAIQCLGEVRRIGKLTQAGDRLLQTCLEFFERSRLDKEKSLPVISAAKQLGAAWPRTAAPVRPMQWGETKQWAHVLWAHFLAAIVEDRGQIEMLASSTRFTLRWGAYEALAAKWPDQTTRALLTQRAVEAPDATERGAACSALGKMQSEFGRILPTQYLNGVSPYLDPLEPIPREHIERAAERAGIRPDDIDATVAALSAHLGWDLTRGAKPSGQTSKPNR
jgi:hypothetical protein